MDGSHGMVPYGCLHQTSPTSAPFIDQHLLYWTNTFHKVSLFGGYVRHVMPVTLPKLFKLISNENRIRNNYEMQSFMKSNVPAIMTIDDQSFAAIESEQYAVEDEAQF